MIKPTHAEKLLPLTIAGLGLAAAYGTQSYLAGYLGLTPSILAAGSIELAYISLALIKPLPAIRSEVMTTARILVYASIAFNLGHAYTVAVPGGLDPTTARFEWLAFVQTLAIAGFIPWVALRLSYVQAAIAGRADQSIPPADLAIADQVIPAVFQPVQAQPIQVQPMPQSKPIPILVGVDPVLDLGIATDE